MIICLVLLAAAETPIITLTVPRHCLRLTRRPNQPDAAAPSMSIFLGVDRQGDPDNVIFATRHHIIPYNVLRDFYHNAIREAEHANILGEHISSRITRIANYFLEDPDLGNSRRNAIEWNGLLDTVAGTFIALDFHDRMMSAFIWMPGNLFYGPSPNLRGDDPLENFELRSNVIIGDDAFERLHTLYQNILRFNDATDRTEANFQNIMAALNEVWNERKMPYAFHREDWDNRDGEWRIRDRANRRNKRQSLKNGEVFPYNSDAGYLDNPYLAAFDFCTMAESAATIKKTKTLSEINARCLDNALLVVAAFAELCFTPKIKRNKRNTAEGRGDWWNCKVDYNQPPTRDNVIFNPDKDLFWTENYKWTLGPTKICMKVSLNTALAITQVYLNKDESYVIAYMRALLWCVRYSYINSEVVEITKAREDMGDVLYKKFYVFKEKLNELQRNGDSNSHIICVHIHNSEDFDCRTTE